MNVRRSVPCSVIISTNLFVISHANLFLIFDFSFSKAVDEFWKQVRVSIPISQDKNVGEELVPSPHQQREYDVIATHDSCSSP